MMSSLFRRSTRLAAVALLALAAGRLSAVEINVSAAASLTDALKEIAATYEKSSGDKLLLNLGASSTLARQIEEGAPADLFLSADEAKMDSLEKGKLVVAGSRKSVLSNTLVVVVPRDSGLKIAAAADLAGPGIHTLALAEPKTVPAGIYAKEYLERLHLWEKLASRVVPTENVRAALSAVEGGNAEAGIVYRTDAGISKQVRIAWEVPAAEGPKISYPFALIGGASGSSRHPEAARKLLAYLESPPALAVFRKYGFLVPP
jgi:molybdate transport system substrate-binding protein